MALLTDEISLSNFCRKAFAFLSFMVRFLRLWIWVIFSKMSVLLEINYAFLNHEGILLEELVLKILAENDSLFCFSLPTVKKEKVAINNSSHLILSFSHRHCWMQKWTRFGDLMLKRVPPLMRTFGHHVLHSLIQAHARMNQSLWCFFLSPINWIHDANQSYLTF